MSVNSIRYCLEHTTDSAAFESLCCDLLSADGYSSIEPIGGTGDGGRDALFASKEKSSKTIFAISLRKDWKTKLKEDLKRIKEVGHECNEIVFAFVVQPTPNERDEQIRKAKDVYDWSLKLYGLERIRVQLENRSNHLISSYPSIFSPRFFDNVAGHIVEKEQRDIVLIDHIKSDIALASWISRRLIICGYNVCCTGLAPFAGLNVDDSLRKLIHKRVIRYLPILSKEGVKSDDLRGRCEAAASISNLIIPLTSINTSLNNLSKRITNVESISFSKDWAKGLEKLVESLTSQDIPKTRTHRDGSSIALSSIIPEPLTKDTPETLYSNVFPVLKIPEALIEVPLKKHPNALQLQELREEWGFVLIGKKAFSFHYPPVNSLIDTNNKFSESLHKHFDLYEGRPTSAILTELIRRCLELVCFQKGMKWCPDCERIYIPRLEEKDSRRISYIDVTGKRKNTGVTGKKSLFRPGPRPNEIYRYFICPVFTISNEKITNSWEVRLRLYLRVTDNSEVPLTGRAIISRRKNAAKTWFNQHWFAKTLAVIQFLSDNGVIKIGSVDRKLEISTSPMSWVCPVSIDFEAINRMMAYQKTTRDELSSQNKE